jgi:hypothetical protein
VKEELSLPPNLTSEESMELEMQGITSGNAADTCVAPPHVVEHIRKQPECRLLWAVLQEAMETYMKYAGATDRRGRRLFAEAEEWVSEEDAIWLCSFVSICHVLELDPGYLRAGLRRWRTTQLASTLRQAA